jgi:hypothetical protein
MTLKPAAVRPSSGGRRKVCSGLVLVLGLSNCQEDY